MGLVVLTDAYTGHNGKEDGQVDGDLRYVAEGERSREWRGLRSERVSRIRDNIIRETRGDDGVLSIDMVARSPILGIMSRGYPACLCYFRDTVLGYVPSSLL